MMPDHPLHAPVGQQQQMLLQQLMFMIGDEAEEDDEDDDDYEEEELPSLFHHCFITVHHCSITPCHHSAPSRYCHCTITAPSLCLRRTRTMRIQTACRCGFTSMQTMGKRKAGPGNMRQHGCCSCGWGVWR